MGQRYQPAELIKLRESPLVVRPATLPPTEEWMGSPPEPQAQQRQHAVPSKNKGSFGNEGQKRPSLGEARQSTRSNVPTNIVLGPPKTAFTSTGALKSPRAFDSPGRSTFGNFGSDTPRADYFSNRKLNGEKDVQKDGTRQYRDADSWGGHKNQYSKQTDLEDGEELESRAQKRNPRQNDWNSDSRRNGTGRDNKPAWAKDEETPVDKRISKEEKDAAIQNIRSRAWRDSDGGQRKQQDYQERNPEWMSGEQDSKNEKHTAQDIEEWKAQMKAQQNKTNVEAVAEDPSHSRTLSGTLKKVEKPLVFDKALDSFFETFSQPQQAAQESTQISEEASRTQQAKGFGKASRFTNFFGPATPTTPSAPQQVPPPAQTHVEPSIPPAAQSAYHTYSNLFDDDKNGNDDKAGFDRMLSMLRSSAPVAEVGVPRLPPDAKHAENAAPRQPQSPTIHSPRSQKKHGLEGILGQHSQPEPQPGVINKQTEFLLSLIRKDEGVQNRFPMNNPQAPGPILPQGRSLENQFFDTPRERLGIDKLNPTASQPRPPQSRPFDHPNDAYMGPPPFGDLAGPPRQPNFDSPPNFPPMAGRGGMMPPPGFPARNMSQPFPPGLGPAMGNLNLGAPDRLPPFMQQGPPPGFNGPMHPLFPPGLQMMGPGQFPQGRPPPMGEMFGPDGPVPAERMKNGMNGNQIPLHQQRQGPLPPPGFPPRD